MQLEGDALHKASTCWMAYTHSVDEIQRYFDEFDPLNTGSLNKDALSQLLTKLNDGIAPLPADIDRVLKRADAIGDGVLHRPELVQASSPPHKHVRRKRSLTFNHACFQGVC